MGIGSVVAAAFILPWGRAHYSPNTLTRLATYLLALVIFSMAFVRQSQLLLASHRCSNERAAADSSAKWGLQLGTVCRPYATQPLPYRDDDATVVPILASMRANYESREAGDRSDTRPAARRDSSGNPNLYSRKQTLPRQARSLAVPKCAVNARWPRLIGPHQLMRKETIQLFSYCG
jgi:hypothetical protein